MNKRIQELAEQAGFILWDHEEWKPESVTIDWGSEYDKELEKFAELIVQQCISEIALISLSNFENEDVAWTTKTAITNIKSHFGVDDEV